MNNQRGVSVVEVILAAALFVVFATATGGVVIQGMTGNRLGVELSVANQFASEGLEAVRSIRNQNFSSLSSPQGGVVQASGVWSFSGANNTLNAGKTYTRTLAVSNVQRDCSGVIVTSGGVNDANTKKVTSTVNWNFTSVRPQTISLTSYLTDWRKTASSGTLGGGMVVYGNGGTTTDAIAYKTLSSAGVWSSASTFDIDSTSTNKALRSIRLFASATRNEKIAITRHLAGTNAQSIYANVFDGSTWTSTQLASWTSNTNTDVRNFDGTYLNNGTFMVVYSDNTSVPKYRTWNGYCWSAQASLVDLATNGSAIPLYIVTKVRPGTNEVMAVFYGTASDTNTQYYNGSSWAIHARHATAGPASQEMVDFVWSPQTTTKGALVYPTSASGASARSYALKLYNTSSGWGSAITSASTGNTIGSMDIAARLGTEEYLSCTENSAQDLFCYRTNSTPAFTTPTNGTITTGGDSGSQRSYDIGYESSGALGLIVYSDNTAIPKLKKYTAATNTFDAAATNLTTVTTVVKSVRIRPYPAGDDMMILFANGGNQFYTVGWNGTTNAVYTSGGRTQTQQGTAGSANVDYWYDFAWDEY